MILKATKLHSMSNDYVVVDISQFVFTDSQLSALATQLCRRHGPVGCDGVTYIKSVVNATATVGVIGPSDSASELCINGLQCAARFVLDDRTQFPALSIPTPFGPAEASLAGSLQGSIEVEGLQFHPVEFGDPHLVSINEPLPDSMLAKVGAELQLDPRFPAGVNVTVASAPGENRVFVRTYERAGAGLTRYCSSGILAAARVLVSEGLLAKEKTISSFTLGGRASVWIGEGSSRLLSNVSTAFDAEFNVHASNMLLDSEFRGEFHYEEAVSYHKWVKKIFAEETLAMIQKRVAQ
jgi:diaminopimelate epimerase